MTQSRVSPVRALLFDVFGTVVDWRSGVAREAVRFGRRQGIEGIDWEAFADAWRARYQPSMEAVRSGQREFVRLDLLHRENLEAVLAEFGIEGVAADALDELNLAWHRLDPWPEARMGMLRLHRRYTLAPLSNGNVALIVDMARRAGLPWDAVLGAEVARDFKPNPAVYLTAADMLGLAPHQCMMVAAHNSDLAAARRLGLATAFVVRPTEHGAAQAADLQPEQDWDVLSDGFTGLATALGC